MGTYKNNRNGRTKPKGMWLLLLLLVLAGAAAYFFLYYKGGIKDRQSAIPSSEHINLAPSTKGDQTFSDAQKQNSTNQTQNSGTRDTTDSSKRVVTPVITTWSDSAANPTVNGYVSGVVEDGGTCTLTLRNGNKVVTQSRQAVANATNTSCGQTAIPHSISPGAWQATLSYSSPTSQGTSSVQNITFK